MENPKYRETVFDELLNENNISLSNSCGYVGEIINTPLEQKQEGIGTEKMLDGGTYLYNIGNGYSLMYDAKDVTATIMIQKVMNMAKPEKKMQSTQGEITEQRLAMLDKKEVNNPDGDIR